MDAPLNYFFHSAGSASQPVLMLGWVFTGVVTLVCLIVAGLLSYALWRRRAAADRHQIEPEEGGVKAVLVGTAISTAVLFALGVYALLVLQQTAHPNAPVALNIKVTGYDWWWRVQYPADGASQGFVTANEIHIPVGKPVQIDLESADVIHAFWVPQLAGKTQMIPGQSNRQWIEADRPGTYLGQCTQFCGVQHAHMAFMVVADNESDYNAWHHSQAEAAAANTASAAHAGEALFVEQCGGCHAVRGTAAAGDHGPDLTHLNSRKKIAAGLLDNNSDTQIRWIEHAQELKPGVRMPDFNLAPNAATQLRAFLSGLH